MRRNGPLPKGWGGGLKKGSDPHTGQLFGAEKNNLRLWQSAAADL